MTTKTSTGVREDDIRGVTGLKLHLRTWPAQGAVRAAVIIAVRRGIVRIDGSTCQIT